MLDKLPNDVLAIICNNIHNIEDLYAINNSCKSLKHFIGNRLNIVDVELVNYNNKPIYFLKNVKNLEKLILRRYFNYQLDFSPICKCKNLKYVYINNPDNIINKPFNKNIIYVYGNEVLFPATNDVVSEFDSRCCIDDDAYAVKNYFESRYSSKKYGKIKYSNKNSQSIKRKHFYCGSI